MAEEELEELNEPDEPNELEEQPAPESLVPGPLGLESDDGNSDEDDFQDDAFDVTREDVIGGDISDIASANIKDVVGVKSEDVIEDLDDVVEISEQDVLGDDLLGLEDSVEDIVNVSTPKPMRKTSIRVVRAPIRYTPYTPPVIGGLNQ